MLIRKDRFWIDSFWMITSQAATISSTLNAFGWNPQPYLISLASPASRYESFDISDMKPSLLYPISPGKEVCGERLWILSDWHNASDITKFKPPLKKCKDIYAVYAYHSSNLGPFHISERTFWGEFSPDFASPASHPPNNVWWQWVP